MSWQLSKSMQMTMTSLSISSKTASTAATSPGNYLKKTGKDVSLAEFLFRPLRTYEPCANSLERWNQDHLNLGNWRSMCYWYIKLGTLENIPKPTYLEETTTWQRALELFHQDDKGGIDNGCDTDSLAVEQSGQPNQFQATKATNINSIPEDNEATKALTKTKMTTKNQLPSHQQCQQCMKYLPNSAPPYVPKPFHYMCKSLSC
ncbi:hypothetical protein ACA910_015657 [Epithemia clementina (nom. ined.)]